MRGVIGFAAIVGVGGCWRAPSASPPVAVAVVSKEVPRIRFALADREAHVLRILAIAPTAAGLKIEREIEIPDNSSHVVWVAPDPAVVSWFDGAMQLSFATGGGIATFPDVPWATIARPAKDAADLEPSQEIRMFGSAHQLVEALCAWKYKDGYEASGQCTTWQYARIWPGPVALLTDGPTPDPDEHPMPVVRGARVRAEVIEPPWHDGASDDELRIHTTCTDAHGVHELKPPETGAYAIRWFVAEPPIFRFDTTSGSGFGTGYTTHVMYEGCTASKRYTNAFAGPHGEVVVVGEALAIYWQCKLVAHAPIAGDAIAFAP
ncbi:MAG: hypothetical protein NT062_34525 [Proteobacteria bacterium]|nr:hypothetical protein [Pseudomonadota bacterium]